MARSASDKTVYLRSGTYSRPQTLTLTSADNGETWQTYPGDAVDSAVIDGGNAPLHGILINGGSNITINGLQVEQYGATGISVHGGAGFESIYPDSVGTANADIVENNYLHDISAPTSINVFQGGGVIFEGQVTNSKMLHNASVNVQGNGYRVQSDSDGNTPNDNVSGTIINGNFGDNNGLGSTETDGIYYQDNTHNSTNITISNNFVRNYTTNNDQCRGIYLDQGASNTTISGNVVGPPGVGYNYDTCTMAIISAGHNDTWTNNIFDLGPNGDVSTLLVLEAGYAAQNNFPSDGDVFTKNIVIGEFSGQLHTLAFGVSGANAYGVGGGVSQPSVSNNLYYNYGGGSMSTGGAFSDSNPVLGVDPFCSTHLYTLASNSPAFSRIGFAPIAQGWGPPGWTISASSAAPSSCGNS
jgi:hypothetical protein